MRFLFLKIPLFLFLILLVCSCSGTDSGGFYSPPKKDSEKNVSYSLDCEKGPVCNNPSFIRYQEYNNKKEITCYWYCGNYKEYKRYEIWLYFDKLPNECWKPSTEAIFRGDERCN
jgi:hypothetical protein